MSKKVLAVGVVGVVDKSVNEDEFGNIQNAQTENPFLCKGKHQEGGECRLCKHSCTDSTVKPKGMSAVETLNFLFRKPHSLQTIEEMKRKMEKCYIPDCGTPFFLTDEHKEKIRSILSPASLCGVEEKACFVAKLSLVGCDEMVPKEILHTLFNEINKLVSLHDLIIKLLVQKHNERCVNYSVGDSVCGRCDVRHTTVNKELWFFQGGCVSQRYASKMSVPSCLNFGY